jgi:uncharacterized protein (TIGR02246 family)
MRISSRSALCLGATVTFIFAAATSVAGAQPPSLIRDPGVVTVPALDHIYEQYSQAYSQLDAKGAAALYTRDALYLQPGRAIQQGRTPIQESFARFFQHSRVVGLQLHITFRIVARQVSDELAYDVGIFTLVTFRNGEEVGRSLGKFVIVSRPDADGAWRFHVSSHSDLAVSDAG